MLIFRRTNCISTASGIVSLEVTVQHTDYERTRESSTQATRGLASPLVACVLDTRGLASPLVACVLDSRVLSLPVYWIRENSRVLL